MKHVASCRRAARSGTALAGLSPAFAGQAPYGAAAPDIPISSS